MKNYPDGLQERFAQLAIARGQQQASTEEELRRLYEEYHTTGNLDCLNDLILDAELLGKGIAYRTLNQNGQGSMTTFQDCLQEISIDFFELLQEDLRTGHRQEDIVRTIRHLYRVRAIDFCRSKFSETKKGVPLSLENINETDEGKKREVVGEEDDGLRVDFQFEQEKVELFHVINSLYLRNILSAAGEPQRPIALCYARFLYQLEMRNSPEEMEKAAQKKLAKDDRKTVSFHRKWTEAMEDIQVPATTMSAKWAMDRMAGKNLRELSRDSQESIQKYFDETLHWSQDFLASLLQMCPYRDGTLWQDIVYTDEFTSKKTSYWADTLHAGVVSKLMGQIQADAALEEWVMEIDSPVKTLLVCAGRNSER